MLIEESNRSSFAQKLVALLPINLALYSLIGGDVVTAIALVVIAIGSWNRSRSALSYLAYLFTGCAIGLIFIGVRFDTPERPTNTFIVVWVGCCGLSLLSWGVIYLQKRKQARSAYPGKPGIRLSRSAECLILAMLVVLPALWGYCSQKQAALDKALVSQGYLQYVTTKALLDRGADVDVQDGWGRTPLALAAADGKRYVVELLLARGAHVDARDNEGRTPLMVSSGDIATLLIEHGANVNAHDKEGHTPLISITTNYSSTHFWGKANPIDENALISVIRLLAKHGADVNARDNFGGTALGIAMTRSEGDAVIAALRELSAER